MSMTFPKFGRRMRELGQVVPRGRVADAFGKLVFEAYGGVIRMSPVDTGRFRASWTAQLDRPDEKVKPPGRYGPPIIAPIVETIRARLKKRPFRRAFINNQLPYARRLEEGWSKQAPSGVAALTVARITATRRLR